MTTDRLAAALRYAAAGWPVFPCKAGTKEPETTHGFHDAELDPARIRYWWDRWRPGANVAVATGRPSGLVVVDVDMKNGVDGFAAWCALATELDLPYCRTRTHVTPSGGFHLLFRYDGWGGRPIRSYRDAVPGVDLKADGGYAVMPPSRYVDPDTGEIGDYEVEIALEPASLPGPLAELWARTPVASDPEPVDPADPYAELRRDLAAAPLVLDGEDRWQQLVAGQLDRIIGAPRGRRNRTVFDIGILLRLDVHDGRMTTDQAERLLSAAAVANGVGVEEPLKTRATITSALSYPVHGR